MLKDTKPHISQDFLKSIIEYWPETGNFLWKKPKGNRKIGSPAGYKTSLGYKKISINGHGYLAHRLAYIYMTGSHPKRIDHINGDKSDNRWINLREATASENRMNSKTQSNNKSGVKGVHFCNTRSRWIGRIKLNGKEYRVGSFTNLEEAALAVQEARKELHGDFARP